MKEVSCKALGILFAGLAAKRLPPEVLLDGVGYPLSHLRNRHERIDWASYARILTNGRAIWSEEELLDLGASFLKSPIVRSLTIIARLLFTPRDIYRFANNPKSGAGNLLFTCIHPSYTEVESNRILLELRMDEGYPPCHEYFVIARGSMMAFPRVLGLKSAQVVMEEQPWGARFDIVYPRGGGVFAWLRRIITFPLTLGAAARELREANVLLQQRYHELEEAKSLLALQAAQLSTAHAIGELIHGDLDLDHTLAQVARALVEVGRFAASRIHIAVDLEGQHIEREIAEGEPPAVEKMGFALEGRRRTVGTLELWPPPGADEARLRELLQMVLPTTAMAIDDALTYTALADYRTNLEAKVVERTRELAEARDSLARTIARMEEAQAARDRLFANINHEIRTPLTLIQFAVADVKRRLGPALDARSAEQLASVDHGVRRLLRMVDGLLLLAARQEGKLHLKPVPFDLAVMLQLTVAAWAPAAEQQGLTLAYSGPKRLPLTADEAAVERIVANLLSNALKFTPRGGSVEVELEARPAGAAFAVRDTGIGIDDEFKRRIFGRFEQGRPAVRPGARGSGIGLSLVKELAEAHGGAVSVECLRGGGSIFRVELPLLPTLVEHAAAASPSIDPGQRSAPNDFGLTAADEREPEVVEANGTARATLLVAEDEPALRRAIVELLRDDYRVVAAADGLSALRLAQRHRPDMLVTDIGMPGMDGIELTRRFREMPGNRLAPSLIITACSNIDDRLSGFDSGAVDYVLKPFEPAELRARIRAQLEVRALALRLHQSEKLAALGTLTAGLAHELRNPASAVVNAIQPLVENLPKEVLVPSSPVAELLEVLRVCAGQIALLSRQLLGFKRGEFERQETPMPTILFRALALTQAAMKGVKLEQRCEVDGPVWCAATLLTQLIANLVENAAHAAGPGGWVRVACALEGGRLVVEVSDSGPGVPPELRERIFEPFFTTKAPGAGTGLGLTTAREIAERHGGSLEVRDAGGRSLFRLEIPAAAPSREERILATGLVQ